MAKKQSASSGAASNTDSAARPSREADDACRYCRAGLRPDDNYCSRCGMPVDPAHDHPLFVVEGLSSLFNVVFFESALEQELNRASRYQHDLSVLVAEIDGLPELEAKLGWAETTQMIRSGGGTLASVIRDADTLASTNRVAALGTQRFLVLLPETSEEGALAAAEKIRRQVENSVFPMGGSSGRVTVSIGVASASDDPGADANLMARATQALIIGRVHGTNRVEVAVSSG
jgi:diguanylate cyclase (GGDEF)-like protein